MYCFDICSLQSGKYPESLELTKVALKVEEKELGSRPERLVELYSLMSEIYDEVKRMSFYFVETPPIFTFSK